MVVIKNDFVQNVLQKWETQTSDIQLLCNVGTLRLATVQCTFHWKKNIYRLSIHMLKCEIQLDWAWAMQCFASYNFINTISIREILRIFIWFSKLVHLTCILCAWNVFLLLTLHNWMTSSQFITNAVDRIRYIILPIADKRDCFYPCHS